MIPQGDETVGGKSADVDDPMELIGIGVPAGPQAMEDMAYVFAEEFAALGFDEARLLRIFRTPSYAAPHRAYRALGEPAIHAIVTECVRVWGAHPSPESPPGPTTNGGR
jgi:hypothetical protein